MEHTNAQASKQTTSSAPSASIGDGRSPITDRSEPTGSPRERRSPAKRATSGSVSQVFYWKDRRKYAFDVKNSDGKTKRHSFETDSEAEAERDMHHQALLERQPQTHGAGHRQEHRQLLGGPLRKTVALVMYEYAHRYTIRKAGAQQELSIINRFLRAECLPELRLTKDKHGKRALEWVGVFVTQARFAPRIDHEGHERADTQEEIARLAATPILGVLAADIDELMYVMLSDGYTVSTAKKYLALLRHMFNVVSSKWGWKEVGNPCSFSDFKAMGSRLVLLSTPQIDALREQCQRRENKEISTMFELALCTALRPGSIYRLQRSEIDLERCQLNTVAKGQAVEIPLSPRACAILTELMTDGRERLFTTSDEAFRQAWREIREAAQQPKLMFRDLRHVAATRLAAAGMSVFALMRVLGHKSPRMAQIYVNLANTDLQDELRRAEAKRTDL